ncbi:MAG: hypothetical protein IJP03_01540 [Christensenellaceae bacterium]|nr:hypothetical protein [Christensenellaceae bacterium]
MKTKRFVIIAGNYGSGKTELSLNIVRQAAAEGKKTMLVDMDIVNPYFRSSEHEEDLKARGIGVVKPCFANTAVDVPSLPADIYAPFDSGVDCAVFDAGGDPVGAAALGLLKERFDANREDTEFLYIVNPMRPLQGTAEEVVEMLMQIQAASRQQVTGLVNNANVATQTTPNMVAEAHAVVEEVSRLAGIPIRFVSAAAVRAKEVAALLPDMQVEPIEISMRPAWLDETC